MAGAGMALVFAPSANAVLASVSATQAGQASGANNAIREVGGVLGVAVLASVFTGAGSYASPQAFVSGLLPGDVGGRGGARRRGAGGAGVPVRRTARRGSASAAAQRGRARAGGARRRERGPAAKRPPARPGRRAPRGR